MRTALNRFGCGCEQYFFQRIKRDYVPIVIGSGVITLKPVSESQCTGSMNAYFKDKKDVHFLRVKGYRNALVRFRIGVSQIDVHRYRLSPIVDQKLSPICLDAPESEMSFFCACPLNSDLSATLNTGLTENVPDKSPKCVLSTNSHSVILHRGNIYPTGFQIKRIVNE